MDLRIGPWNRVRALTAAAGWIVLILLLAILLLSVAFAPGSNLVVRLTLAGFCILAVARPADSLLVTTALLGFGVILSHLAHDPALRVTEVLVVASLGGACARAFVRDPRLRRAITDQISAPVALFALLVVVSTIVWLRVYQVHSGEGWEYVQALLHFATVGYFVEAREVVSAATILEGLALYVVVAAFCRADDEFFERGLRMLAVGGAGLATTSLIRLWEIVLRNPHIVQELRATNLGLRISPQIADYIAAGSYFSLCWLVALGVAIASTRRRAAWVAAGAPLIAGLYLTGSRSVIAAAVGGLIVLVLSVFARQRAAAVRGIGAFAVITLIVMVISFPRMIGHDVAGETARASLWMRAELLRVGTHVIGTRPLFGVGVDRFYLVAANVTSPLLESQWQSRRNPHNDLLRFAGELGLLGLSLFLWILIRAGVRLRRALQATGDPLLAGVAAGLIAFLITSMVSNPLMLREVSYAFWIALGLAAGRSAAFQRSARPSQEAKPAPFVPRTRFARFRFTAALLAGGLVVAFIPYRVRQELTTVDPARVSYGLSDWEREADGTRYRWSGPEATVFVTGRARRVEIPVSGTLPSGVPQHVQVRLDGRLVNDIAVGPAWQPLAVVLPARDRAKSRRIDLTVSPTWVRADAMIGSEDGSVVGVKVGELNVIR